MNRPEIEPAPEHPADATPLPQRQTLGDRAVEGIRWMGVARVIVEAAAFGGSLVLARFISPAEFGRAAAALGLAAIAPNFLMQTFASPVIQFPTLQRAHIETAVLLSLVAGALFLVLAPVLSVAAVEPLLGRRVAYLFLLATPIIGAAAIAAVPRALLQRTLAFRTIATIDIAALVGGTTVSTLLATLAGLDGEALVLGLVAAHVLTALLLLLQAPRTAPRWRGGDVASSLLRFGGSVGLSSVLATVTANIDYIVLSARLRAADVGFYWRAFHVGVTYQGKISSIMLSVALPVYSRAPNAEEMRRLRLRVMATHAAILFPVLVTLMIVAPVLVPWLFGARWEPSVVPTQILAGAGMVAAVVTGTSAYIIALGKPKFLPVVNVTAIVGLGSTAYFAAPLGLRGVAACVLGYYVFILFVNHYWLLHRIGGIQLRDLFRDAGPPLAASIPLAAAEFGVMKLLQGAASPLILAVTIPAGLITYAAVLRVAFPQTWKSLRRIADRVLGRRSSRA